MTSEIKVNVPRQGVQAYFGKKRFNQFLVVIGIILATLLLGACATVLPESQAPTQAGELSAQRAFEAQAARYEAMTAFYAVENERSPSTFLAANPELAIVQRYAAAVKMTESEILGANPELKVVQHYTFVKNESGQPVTFDVEALRETYDKDWGIEADAIDVSLTDLRQNVHSPGR